MHSRAVLFVLVAVAVVAFILWVGRTGRREEARLELPRFSHRDWTDGEHATDWDFDLAEMTLAVTTVDLSSYAKDEPSPTIFSLRRRDGGVWEAKMTEASRLEGLADAQRRLAAPTAFPTLRHLVEDQVRAFEKPTEWEPVRDDLAGPLESQFQRFVRHALP